MFSYQQRVECGIINSDEGLKYFQEVIDKQLGEDVIIKVTSYSNTRNYEGKLETVLNIDTNIPIIISVADLITKTFNRRKRWIKIK